jgi:lysozyme
MNENRTVGAQFFRLIDEFENAPPDCRQTPDGCALDAYLCPSRQWTIGDGCCFWEDGTPVKEGDTLEDGPGLAARRKSLLAYNAGYCEEYVRANTAVELDENQFDALCSFRFNTRETTLRNSSRLLPAINAKEWQKAAIAFTEFVYGTSSYNGKPYQEAMRGLLRRRLWEGLIFLGLDPQEAVKDKDVALPSDMKLLSSGTYRDMIRSEGLTTLNQVKMKATPLASSELVLNTPAPPTTMRVPEATGAGPLSSPSPSVVPVPPKVSPTVVPSAEKPAMPTAPSVASQAPVPAPLPPRPKLPDPPVPIGQQTSAVDNARRSEEWSSSPKAMIFSRRFWGLFLVLIGRLWMLKTGSNAVLGAVSDPLVMEMFSGFMVMVIGELLQHWGERKAKRSLC